MITPILMLGAGRMGGAILEGWARAGAFAPAELMIVDPQPSEAALAAERAGARLNPLAAELARIAVPVTAAPGAVPRPPARASGGRRVARSMRPPAAAIGQGAASLYADDPAARAAARVLFEPLGIVVDLADEAQMHAA